MTARNVESIIERQIRSWEIRERLSDAEDRGLDADTEGPWISISRQLGSGDAELSGCLAGTLGWQVYDNEILTAIGRNTNTRQAVLSHFDKRAVEAFSDYVGLILAPDVPGRAEFLIEMTQVIWGIARRGHAIIMGRGANWFLKPESGLRARIVAPLEERARRLSQAQEGTSMETARQHIIDHDRTRAEFMRQTYNRDIDDPEGYDLILNTGGISPATAAQIVITAMSHKLTV